VEGLKNQRIAEKKFPDLGLEVPKSQERKACRQALALCIQELQARSNEKAFIDVTLNFFKNLGVEEPKINWIGLLSH
jgi:hypothetical protein